MQVEKIIKENVQAALKELFKLDVELSQIVVEHPQDLQWGDYSSNIALVKAKELGKAPAVLAKEICSRLEDKNLDIFENISVAGPGFLNFTLTKDFFLSQMFEVLKSADRFGARNIGNDTKIALEHSNVNPNKAAHIGHLRNAVIGQFLERVYEFIGYNVNVQYYSNDLGVQVSTSLLGMRKLGLTIDAKSYKKFDHYAWDIYSKISQMIDADPKLKGELDRLTVALDSREPEVGDQQKELSKRILLDNLTTFSYLDIDYDLIVYESSIKDAMMWEATFEILKKNDKIYLSENGPSKGCWLIKMSKSAAEYVEGVEEDKIIVRSNGIPTYTGKDIAYHLWKYGLLEIDFKYKIYLTNTQDKPLYETGTTGDIKDDFTNNKVVIDVIDVRQTYAIDAVRTSLSHLGYKEQSGNLIHINYGHVYLSNKTAKTLGFNIVDGIEQVAMSGRKGIGVKIDDFIDMVDAELKNAHGDFPNKKDIRNSAIKFDILRYDTFQDIVFDIDSALNIKGFTGPYIEYSHARANSLLEKAGFTPDWGNQELLSSQFLSRELNVTENTLLKVLYKFPEVVLESALQYAPGMLCVYLYDLCQKFNSFYNESPIINAENLDAKNFRLYLTAAFKQVVRNGLYLLGIRAVDRM